MKNWTIETTPLREEQSVWLLGLGVTAGAWWLFKATGYGNKACRGLNKNAKKSVLRNRCEDL